jgi:hypothetical protein
MLVLVEKFSSLFVLHDSLSLTGQGHNHLQDLTLTWPQILHGSMARNSKTVTAPALREVGWHTVNLGTIVTHIVHYAQQFVDHIRFTAFC